MGTETAQTVKEIEQARERISNNLRQLEGRLPSPVQAAKRAGTVAVGGGAGGGILWFAVRRLMKKRAKRKQVVVSSAPVQAIVQLVPERWASAVADGRGRAWAAGMGSALILLELMELRRLRSLNKALVATRR